MPTTVTATIKTKRGNKSLLPTLSVGEQGFCNDTHELFIGHSAGNKRITYPVYFSDNNGLVGDNLTDNKANFDSLVTAIGATDAEIVFTAGTYSFLDNVTVPANITLNLERAIISIANTKTFTINGRIKAGLKQIFTGSGSIAGTPKVTEIYPEWFGAVGDGVTDDYTAISKAIALYSKQSQVILQNKVYAHGTALTISKVLNLTCYGELKYTGSDYAVIQKNVNCNINIFKITSAAGGGVKFYSDTLMMYGNKFNVDNILTYGKCIYFATGGYGMQHNKFEFKLINSSHDNAIEFYAPTLAQWIGENRFYTGQIQSVADGIHLVGAVSGSTTNITGTRFICVSLEGVNNGVYLKNTAATTFISARTEESITNKILVLDGYNTACEFGFDMLTLDKIDVSLATGGVNYIRGHIMNNTTEYGYVTDRVRISVNILQAIPTSRKNKNLFTDSVAVSTKLYTLNIDARNEYNMYTDIMALDTMTLTIGKSYYLTGWQDLLISVQTHLTLVDADGNTIIAGTETAYNYKVIRVRKLTTSFGVAKWQVEIVTTLS